MPCCKRFANFLAALLMLAAFATPGSVWAWGETGHRVVCQIAYDELLPAARIEVDRLLALDPDFDAFAESCLYADTPERIRWQDHFINIPRSDLAITTFDCPTAETCILPAIRDDFLVLLNAESADADKLLALKLLGHWVGDVHQPMHVSFQDDRGANSNKVESDLIAEPDFANLHGVWDYLIIAHNFGDDYQAIARSMRREITQRQRQAWRYDSPIEWANESYQVTISAAALYCVHQQGACWYEPDNMLLDPEEEWRSLVVDAEYLQRHGPLVQERLQQAGVRLARLLNQSLTMEENNEKN